MSTKYDALHARSCWVYSFFVLLSMFSHPQVIPVSNNSPRIDKEHLSGRTETIFCSTVFCVCKTVQRNTRKATVQRVVTKLSLRGLCAQRGLMTVWPRALGGHTLSDLRRSRVTLYTRRLSIKLGLWFAFWKRRTHLFLRFKYPGYGRLQLRR